MMDTEKELLELISQRTGYEAGRLRDDLDFERDLNISRDELVGFVSLVEDKFKISFADEHLEEIKTVGDLKNLALEHLGVFK